VEDQKAPLHRANREVRQGVPQEVYREALRVVYREARDPVRAMEVLPQEDRNRAVPQMADQVEQ